MTRDLELHFGALAPDIAQQMEEQGFSVPDEVVRGAQADADAVTRLFIRGVLPPAQTKAARDRIGMRLSSHPQMEDKQQDGGGA